MAETAQADFLLVQATQTVQGDGTAGLTLLNSGLGGRTGAGSVTIQIFEIQLDAGVFLDDSREHLAQQLFALVAQPRSLSSS